MTCVLVNSDDSWIQWMIAEVRPDVIVLDMMLAPASGWGFGYPESSHGIGRLH